MSDLETVRTVLREAAKIAASERVKWVEGQPKDEDGEWASYDTEIAADDGAISGTMRTLDSVLALLSGAPLTPQDIVDRGFYP